MSTLGADFVKALAEKDANRLHDVIHPEIDFRGMTPNKWWEAKSADELVSILLESWFEDDERIEGVEHLETDGFADRDRVGYRFAVENSEGRYLVEQQAYIEARDGKIGWMRVLCAGYRPVQS